MDPFSRAGFDGAGQGDHLDGGVRRVDAGVTVGAAGAVEGVFTVLSVHHQIAPGTINYEEQDPEILLDVVHGGSREMEIRYAMSDNIGLGGHNGAVIFKRYAGD